MENRQNREFLICVDSDGCVMDTMAVKHAQCFGPCLVAEWRLEPWRSQVLAAWNHLNLYTRNRGVNRFRGLALALRRIDETCTPICGIETYAHWARQAETLSETAVEDALEEAAARGNQAALLCFTHARNWSRAVNRAVAALPETQLQPFYGALEGLKAAHEKARVVVVSGANRDAVFSEWTRWGLLPHADRIMAQDAGSKAACIRALMDEGYDPDHVLMVGDAPGDLDAAKKNGVWFYPILARQECASWQAFRHEALPRFLAGDFGAYAAAQERRFLGNLEQS